MVLFRFIPGVLWLDVLDDVTDQCQSTIFGEDGWRWPCNIAVMLVWMTVLGELRVQAVKAITYVTVAYYRPNQKKIKSLYGRWPARLALCSTLCGLSYYFTFEFEDDFPYLQDLKESIQNDRYSERIDEIHSQREVFLMAHVFVQRFLHQVDSIIWILCTVLRLKRKRFVSLVALVWLLKPLSSMMVQSCGNFALWLLIGQSMIQLFVLIPSSHPRLGSVGCFCAVTVSTIYWRKYGTVEILITLVAAIGAEISWQRTVAGVKEKSKRREKEGKKASVLDRAWGYVTSLFAPDDDAIEQSSSTKEEKIEPIVEYTKPSLTAWMSIVVSWAAMGILLDGYDLMATF